MKKRKIYIKRCCICSNRFLSKAHNAKYCKKCKVRICKHCGKQFEIANSEILGNKYNKPKKYCSSECYHEATKGKIPWNKEKDIPVKCIICDKYFTVWKSRMKYNVKYCSLKCKHEGLSRRTGIDHPLWKGGYTFYGRKLSENNGSYYRNRKLVLKRDNNTCQICGDKRKSKEMDVHHIISVREEGENTLLNMITLCRKCHNHADKGWISSAILRDKTLKVA